MRRTILDVRLKAMLALVLGATFACNQSPTAPHERFTLLAQVAAADGTAAKALKAEIAGTNLFAQTDAGGRFSISAAPQGPATLHLSGPGVDTSLQLPGLDDGLVVRIAVGLSNDGKAFLKGQPEVLLRGTVASAIGGDLRVAASTIHVDGNTIFDAGSASSLSRLVGQVVNIQGLQAANGSIQAANVNGGGGNKNEVKFVGPIDAISGLDLTVDGFTVHTSAATKFSGGKPNVTSVAGLHAGDTVEVRGSQQVDGSVAAAEVKVQRAAVAPPPPPPPPPAAPTANAGPAQAVASGAFVTLDGSASSDATGIAVAFQWSQTAGPAVTLSSATVALPTFTAPAVAFDLPAAVLTFSLVVSDANGTSAPATVNVTVTPQPPPPPPPAPPIADAGPDQAVASGAFVTLDGSASADPAALPLTFSWTQTAGAIVTLSSGASVTPTFTAPS